MKHLTALIMLLFCQMVLASTTCESSRGIDTPAGALTTTTCYASSGETAYRYLSISDKKLIQSTNLYYKDRDKQRATWVYAGNWHEGSILFLLDLSANPPKAWAFGVGQSSNEFDYASWSARNSVIAVKDNVKFVYQDHRFILPNAEFAASHSYADPRNRVFSKDGKIISSDLDQKNVPFAMEIDPSVFK